MADGLEIAFQVARWAGLAFVAAVSCAILIKLSSGAVNIAAITMGRGQLLITTIGVAGAYAYMVTRTVHCGQLPAPSPVMIGLLGASHGTHLSLKLAETWPTLFTKTS